MPQFLKLIACLTVIGPLVASGNAQAFWSGPCVSFGPGGFGFRLPFSYYRGGTGIGTAVRPANPYPIYPGYFPPPLPHPMSIPPEPPLPPSAREQFPDEGN